MTVSYCDICGERQGQDDAYYGEAEISGGTAYVLEMPERVLICICPSCMRKIIDREPKK